MSDRPHPGRHRAAPDSAGPGPTDRSRSGIRLLHVTTVPESLGFMTGQIGFLKARGIDTFCVSSPGPLLATFAETEGIPSFAVEMPRRITPFRDLLSVLGLRKVIREVAPHIVHAHTPKAGLLGTIAARLTGVPVRVYHMQGLPMLASEGMRTRLLRASERVSCRLAHRVICVRRSVRDVAIVEKLCDPSKIIVLAGGSGNGVDALGLFDPASLPERLAAMSARNLEKAREFSVDILSARRRVFHEHLRDRTEEWLYSRRTRHTKRLKP